MQNLKFSKGENLRMNKGNEMENLIRHRLNEMKEVEQSEEKKKNGKE